MLKYNNKIRNKLLFFLLFLIAFLFANPLNTFSQGRDRSKYRTFGDTTSISFDTTSTKDTSIVKIPVDSTARIKYFVYNKKDEPVTEFGKYKYPILLSRSSNIDYKIVFDTLNNVSVYELIDGEPIKVPVKLSFDKYMELRSRLQTKDIFYKLVADFFKITTEDELQQLFKSITDITIPLPFASETIFGPPTINLKINGVIDITGSYQKTKSDQSTILQESQTQNNINFKQEVQVTTKGSIGDKLTIDADWNSQRTFEFENQLKLKYTGYPDEVIQSLEAGNVSLETKSNLIGSTQSLFGIKGQFKLGPFTITALASQKKSEKKEVNITGGTQETPINTTICEYSDNHFLLDTAYESIFESFYNNGITPREMNVNDIEVWAQTVPSNPNKRFVVGTVELKERPANGYDPNDSVRIQSEIDGQRMSGYFYQLSESNGDYTIHREAGYLSINVTLSSSTDNAIAVAYKRNNSTVQYGDFLSQVGSNDALILKIIRYRNLQPPDNNPNHTLAWRLKLKNIYSLGVRNIRNDPNNIVLDIEKRPPGADPIKVYTINNQARSYLNLTGLDYRRNGDPTTIIPEGDGKFDFFPNTTIDLANGYLIFPTLRPFSTTLKNAGVNPDSLEKNDTIYTSSKTTALLQQIKFYLVGKAIGDASSRYSLGFNVVEGSVKVFNGSVQLAEGVDFTIDYTGGELVIRNASALVSGSNLKITYETNDLFQLASKTLVGTRAELQINKTSYVGFTLLNLKQQTLNEKVRIGEEPTNNTILGFDASTDIKVNGLTKLLNKIPGYNTKEESVLNLKGEVAFMIPDPNTKKSLIPSDNGEAVAYIDDFEGSKKLVPLGLNPLTWTISSIPIDPLLVPIFNSETVRDSLMTKKRSKMNWYTLVNDVAIKDVYPNKNIASNQNQSLSPLVMDIKPDTAGAFNYISQSDFTLNSNGLPTNNWCGLFKYLNTSQTNLFDENIDFIEIWMKVANQPGDSAKMLVDLGTISEKIITSTLVPPRKDIDVNLNYHTEDLNRNGILDEGEDIGLDGYSNKMEIDTLELKYGLDLGADPSRDNYNWSQNNPVFSYFNGTEGNANLSEGKRPDTEDLNGNGNLDIINNYFEYEISLDTNKFRTNPYILGGGNNGWYQFKVRLGDFKRQFGDANFTNVQYIRVWFKGFSNYTQLKIVDFNLVGNQWVKSNRVDSTYSISVVNIEDNSSEYMSPVPGDILRQKDATNTDQNVLLNEQSLSVDVRNLLPGQGKFAFKSFTTRPLDLLNYKILKMFVNGDNTFKYRDSSNHDAEFVLRLGSDTANYYEYRAPCHPDTRPSTPWNALNEVTINLADLTSIKQIRDSLNLISYVPVSNGPPGSKYGIIGNPTITGITQIVVGVINTKNNPVFSETITGSVWFNELRVIKADDNNGYAFNLNASLKIADFANLNFSFSKVDPNFHTLENRFGTRILANNWELSGTINAGKVANALLSSLVSVKFKDFFTIPITFSHSELIDNPKFIPNTDIDIESAVINEYNSVIQNGGDPETAKNSSEQIRTNAQTVRINDRFSINGFKFNFPGENFLAKELLNKIEISFYKNSVSEHSPTAESRYAWDMGGQIGLVSSINLNEKWNINIGRLIPLGDDFKNAKIYFFYPFLPLAPLFATNIGVGTQFVRSRGDEKLRSQLYNSPTSRNFASNRNMSMDWKFIENWIIDIVGNYTFGAGSDLTYLETTGDSVKTQRPEKEIMDDIFSNHGIINFGNDLNYTQTININPKFNIPFIRNIFDITASYRVQYGWQTSTTNISLGSNVGYNSDLQASVFFKLNQLGNFFKIGKISAGANSIIQNNDKQGLGEILKILKSFIPDQITAVFTQNKTVTNPAIKGQPGFGNFWMAWKSDENSGPSRLYQLGWIDDPGPRIPNVNLQDRKLYANTLNLSTFINPIFPDNLKITFNYKTGWATDNSYNYTTDTLGNLGSPTNRLQIRTISRPSFFIPGDIIPKLAKPDVNLSSEQQSKEISTSFENDVVSFPFPAWTLTLNGIEKFELFSGFAQSFTFESGYTTEYKKTYKFDAVTDEVITAQGISTGFNPLIGLNLTFKEIEGGNLTASFKINKTNNYDLDPASARINNNYTSDFSINASYTKSGFSIPLFGLSLQNDLTIAFSYTKNNNDPQLLEYKNGIWISTPQNGTLNTTLNPSIQYALSKTVTLQIFYKYTKIEPSKGNIQIPTRTSNEAGLNLKLSIQ